VSFTSSITSIPALHVWVLQILHRSMVTLHFPELWILAGDWMSEIRTDLFIPDLRKAVIIHDADIVLVQEVFSAGGVSRQPRMFISVDFPDPEVPWWQRIVFFDRKRTERRASTVTVPTLKFFTMLISRITSFPYSEDSIKTSIFQQKYNIYQKRRINLPYSAGRKKKNEPHLKKSIVTFTDGWFLIGPRLLPYLWTSEYRQG